MRRRRNIAGLVIVILVAGAVTVTSESRSQTSASIDPAPCAGTTTTCQVLYGWGNDDGGQAGVGTVTPAVTSPEAIDAPATSFLSVAAGSSFAIGANQDGTLLAWGGNSFGQLGTGGRTSSAIPVPVAAPAGVQFQQVAAGSDHALALSEQGTVYAWGTNAYGQLGNGSTSASSTPVAVAVPGTVVAIAAGGSESMALTDTGQLYTWGANFSGQLGDGMTADSDVPVAVELPTGVQVAATPGSLAVGADFCIVVTADGTAYSWGSDSDGQLGDGINLDDPAGVTHDSSTPAPVVGISGIASVAAGQAFVLALTSAHHVYTWGSNISGQLGMGGSPQPAPPPDSSVPIQPIGVVSEDDVIGVAAGSSTAYAVDSSGLVWSWGDNYFGQLADGSVGSVPGANGAPDQLDALEPKRVPMPPTVAAAEVVAGPSSSSAFFVSGIDQTVTYTGLQSPPNPATPFKSYSASDFATTSSGLPPEVTGATGGCRPNGDVASFPWMPGFFTGVFTSLPGSTAEPCNVDIGQAGGLSNGTMYNPAPPLPVELFSAVTPLPLTLAPESQSAPAGLAPPDFAYRIEGFVDEQSRARDQGRASCTTTATDKSPPGNYPITCTLGTLVVPGYSISQFTTGTLTLVAVNPGYDLVGQDGSVYTETGPGVVPPDLSFAGSLIGEVPSDIVGAALVPGGAGYWLAGSDGGVYTVGGAQFYGSAAGGTTSPVVGMAATTDGGGYWLVSSDGNIYPFGDATSFGSLMGTALNAPAVGMAATPDGKGYWVATSDGGVFAFGDAGFFGSGGGRPHGYPVTGIASTPRGRGYWLTTSAGGIYFFGDATYEGGLQFVRLSSPIVGITASPVGHGYWMSSANGDVYAFGSAPSLNGVTNGSSPIVAIISEGKGHP